MSALPGWLIQLRAVILKEIRQIRSDRRILPVLVVMPIIQVTVFSWAINFEVDDVPTVVVDQDHTATSREHARRLLADGTLSAVATVDDPEQALDVLVAADAAAALVLPEGLERDLLRGEPAQMQVLLDGSDPNRSGVAAGAVARYAGERSTDLLRARYPQAAGGLTVEPRVLYNPQLETAMFMVPGVAAMLLIVVTTLVTAMGLAREKEMGTLEQVMVTPIPPWVLLLGKIAPYVAVGLFDVTLALAMGAWVFDLPLRGGVEVLAGATLLYLLSTLGVGLLLSTFSDNQQQAFLGGFLFMMPTVLLSGNLTPVAAMPGWLRWITWFNPLRYYIEILRANLLKGAGWSEVWPQGLALLLFGATILLVSVRRFRKRMA
jgi:ABC-2 type transport system permease protein